jgi:hypothetical protein
MFPMIATIIPELFERGVVHIIVLARAKRCHDNNWLFVRIATLLTSQFELISDVRSVK